MLSNLLVNLLFFPLDRTLAQQRDYSWGMGPGMMGNWGMGGFGMVFMMVFSVLVIVGVVFLIEWLIQTAGSGRATRQTGSGAVEILKQRYARGEINKAELLKLFQRKRKDHCERVYPKYPPTEFGWYQGYPERSLKLIDNTCAAPHCRIIDVGGGTSLLAKCLLEQGYRKYTVLDISGNSIKKVKSQLGAESRKINWIEADITKFVFTDQYDVWHDRAVFHFLTKIENRRNYITSLNTSLKLKGHLIMATFSLDGPTKCSGLSVVRYSPESLQNELGGNFHLAESFKEIHLTPTGISQSFVYCRFAKHA